jgi:hypothetical protein
VGVGEGQPHGAAKSIKHRLISNVACPITLLLLLLLLLLPSAACDACPTELNPYCVNSTPWGPRTFANCCFIKCNNISVLSNVLHPGVCKQQCVEKCDEKLERPLCCQGRTYKNGCFALCNGEDTGRCSQGRCSSGNALI